MTVTDRDEGEKGKNEKRVNKKGISLTLSKVTKDLDMLLRPENVLVRRRNHVDSHSHSLCILFFDLLSSTPHLIFFYSTITDRSSLSLILSPSLSLSLSDNYCGLLCSFVVLMESWAFASEGKGLLFSDDIDLSVDAFAKSRKALTGWDKESVESMGFIDLGFSELLKKPFSVSNAGGVGIVGIAEGSSDSSSKVVVTSPNCVVGSNSSLESVSNLSNSFMDSNSQDSPLIDLKLGRLVDSKDGIDKKFYKERSVLSSANQTIPAKRARTVSSRLHTPFCQVYGCNKDLSSSKDYHKRHKVCEIHSKTPKVVVNGIEQRFCQQCSRFHLLVEFDDGKRSCRKRLAGHNERRRKPQFDAFSVKPHKLLQSYQGTKFLGSLPKRASFLFPNIVPGGVLYPERSEQASWSRNVKVEERETYSPQTTISKTSSQLSPKSLFHLHGCRIQCSSGISSAPTEDYAVFNTAPTINELAGVPHSSCALSLLSAESQDLGYSSGNVIDRPSISQASRAHHSSSISDKTLGMWYSQKDVSNDFISSGMTSTEINHMAPFMVPDIGYGTNHQTEANGFSQGLDFLNTKYCTSPERGSTVNLLELSSHLQRVEQQRNSMHVKQENEESCRYLTTYKV